MKMKQLVQNLRAIQLILAFLMGLGFVNAQGFVQASGTEFEINGNPFYFAGANNYYLFYKPLSNVQEVMDDADSLGLKVIRTWGFCDGTCSDASYNSFQTSPGVYNEATFQKFDRIIKEASDRNLKLTVPLVNNWDNFGGMCQYAKWCNVTNASICDADEPWPFGTPTQVHDAFYSNSCTKQIYKSYVNYFLNRTNTLTGIKYKDDPTIFAWELANEPRARSNKTGVVLNSWIGEMSAYVKSIDSNHMVTPGSDGGYLNKPSDPEWSWWYHGNEGQDFIANHQWPSVDFTTFRYYPEAGKFDDVNYSLWIKEHAEDSHSVIGKPVVMEEFGSVADKQAKMSGFYSEIESNSVNGDTFWLLADSQAAGNDGYFVFCPGDSVCNVISNHADYMNGLSVDCSTDSECDYLDGGYCALNNIMHDEGRCITGKCQAETTMLENCDDGDPLTMDTCLANLTCSHVFVGGCVMPTDDMNITYNTTLCNGNFYLPNGINIAANGVALDCNGSTISGNRSTFAVDINGYSRVTVKNCILNLTGGINAVGNYFTAINNTLNYGMFIATGNSASIINNVGLGVNGRGSNLLISGNTFNFVRDHVIYLIRVYNSTIINNNLTCINWGRCVSLDGVEGTLFENNTIHDGGSGIYCWYSCRHNSIIGNTFLNDAYGLTGSAASNYYNTTVCRNYFANNVNDAGLISNSTTKWNCSNQGNHWSKYDEPAEGCNNLNNDGICDLPYNIGSGKIDNFPLTPYSQGQSCVEPSSNLVLSSNTVFCEGDYNLEEGMTINSSNVILDCNGAHIIGAGTSQGVASSGVFDLNFWINKTSNLQNMSPIINNIAGFISSIGFIENITVKNCNIEGFENGLNMTAIKNLELVNNTVHDNRGGIVFAAYYGTIKGNKAYNNGNGIVGGGIDSTLENNEVSGSNSGMLVIGIGNNIIGNKAQANTGTGITVAGFDNVVYGNNAISNSGNDGISLVYSAGAEVYNNTAENNSRAGISIIEGSNNTVSWNVMRNNGFGFGMEGLFSPGPSEGNVISNNTISGSSEAGIGLNDGNLWKIGELLFGRNAKIQGHRVIGNTFTGNILNNTADLFVYGKEVSENNFYSNDFYGGGVLQPGDNKFCVDNKGNNYHDGAQVAPGEC